MGVLRVMAGGDGGDDDLGGLDPVPSWSSSSPTSSTSTSTSSSSASTSTSVRGESGQGECDGDLRGLLDTGEPTNRPTPNDNRSVLKHKISSLLEVSEEISHKVYWNVCKGSRPA